MDSGTLILLISLSSLLSFYLQLFFKSTTRNRGKSQHNNPILDDLKPYPLLGHFPQLIKNLHRSNDWTTDLLAATPTNTFTFCRQGNMRTVITANPANVEHMLKSNFDNYPKGHRVLSTLQDFLGIGIFNSDGQRWKAQRKTASFEFNTRSLRDFVVRIVQHETMTRLLPLLEKCSKGEKAIDIQEVLERYAFDSVCRLAFNEDPACLAEDADSSTATFAQAFRDASELSVERFRYPVNGFWKIKKMFGVGSERRLKESIATVHDFAAKIIRSRRRDTMMSDFSKPQADDLLSKFMANKDYSDELLRDIVISFILAGRETTSSALTWFFWILSSRPDVEKKILAEITSIRSRGVNPSNKTFEFDELRDMQYLHAAITESMRLYPPVPSNLLTCQEDEVLPDGTEIKKGWSMSYHSYAMGRMERIWGEDCREYRPERWLDDAGMFRPESPFKFVVFHGGPRMCLGKEMAYIQMKSIAACVLERFLVEVVEKGKEPKQMFSLTLRMRGGLAVCVKSRPATN